MAEANGPTSGYAATPSAAPAYPQQQNGQQLGAPPPSRYGAG
jgi:hypothetical protein